MSASADLDDADLPALAARLERAQRELGAIRYGSVFRVGVAHVVLNPDSPLAAGNFAATVAGSPAAAEETLDLLPRVWGEAGRSAVALVDSPSSVPELGFLAEEAGYEATEEGAVLVLTEPATLAEGEPGRRVVPLADRHEPAVVPLLADAYGYSLPVERRLRAVVGQRLDDPRVSAFAALAGEELAGVVLSCVSGDVAQVADLAVAAAHRGRGVGRALVSAAAADGLTRGATTVFATAEAGGSVERFLTAAGFTTAYETVTYLLRL